MEREALQENQNTIKVCMIALEFYPCAVTGAHRPSKFAKYLSKKGYGVTVLYADSAKTGWNTDEKLEKDIPGLVHRVEVFYPFSAKMKEAYRKRESKPVSTKKKLEVKNQTGLKQYLAIPDKNIYWLPFALWKGYRVARKSDVVYVTSPPHSSLVTAAVMAKLARRPLVLDLRDPWTINHLVLNQDRKSQTFAAKIHKRLERWVFKRAAAVICNTEPVRKRYTELYPELQESCFSVITNGYDPSDIQSLESKPYDGKMIIGYFGTIYAGRDPSHLFAVVRKLIDRQELSSDEIELRFFGNSHSLVEELSQQYGVRDVVKSRSAIPYSEALKEMGECHALLMIGSGETDDLHIPAKVYEYIAMNRTVLAFTGKGALYTLMQDYQFGLRAEPTSEDEIEKALLKLREGLKNASTDTFLIKDPTVFTRESLTGSLAEIIEKVVSADRK